MELIFIHINNPYGILKGQSFNLSSKYEINYDLEGEKLTINDKGNHLNNFFGKNIRNITCVIGENGVGKTTFLRYIKELYFERRNEIDIRNGDIVAYVENGFVYVHASSSLGFLNIENRAVGLSSKLIHYKKKPKIFDHLKNDLTIYYSNNFDLYDDFIESEILYNTSTPFLTRTYNARINKEFGTKKVNAENRFLLNEFQRNRKFLQSSKSETIKSLLKSVDYIEIIPISKKDIDYKNLIKKIHKIYPFLEQAKQREEYKIDKKVLIEIINDTSITFYRQKEKILNNSKRELFEVELTEIIVFEVLVKLIQSDYVNNNLDLIKEAFTPDAFNIDTRFFLRTFIKEMKLLFFELNRGLNKELLNEREQHKKAFDFKDYFKKIENLADLLIYNDNLWEEYSERATVTTNSELLDKIIQSYFELPFSTNSIKLDWSRLSAGEESMITFFSRIDAALRLKSKKRNDILILIDEGDLYFHPEWQRQYLKAIIEFLNQYKEFNFQIILTSHSPFVLSDLPQNNVITFERREKSINVSKNKLSKTFGGNIHELLIDKFFLNNGVIGAFADKKIIELIKRVNDKKITEQDDFLINEIGDKFLSATIRTNLEEDYDKDKY
jgi:predicted ATP-binding protein involved in virulence